MMRKGRTMMSRPLTDQKVPTSSSLEECLNAKIKWSRTKDPTAMWRAQLGTQTWTVRVNDFPEEHLYTLFVDDKELGNFNEWPRQWSRAEERSKDRSEPLLRVN
jgi:hypothetical protein